MAKVALRFGCAKQSKNLERYLIKISCEKTLSYGTKEITRLDINMQQLIRYIFSLIIDSYFYFPQRFSDFSYFV